MLGCFLSADPLVAGSSPLIVNLALSSVQGLNLPAKAGSFAASRAPANPQSLDRYSYVMNNPLRYTDPSGLFASEEEEAYWKWLHHQVDPSYWGEDESDAAAIAATEAYWKWLHYREERALYYGPLVSMIAELESGKPYVFGKKGDTNGDGIPDAFDCSGLVEWSMIQAGVDVPITNAEGQYQWTRRIERSQLQCGDLVFWGETYGGCTGHCHVAIYAGGGKIVAADSTEGKVIVMSLDDYETRYMGPAVDYGRPPY